MAILCFSEGGLPILGRNIASAISVFFKVVADFHPCYCIDKIDKKSSVFVYTL